MEICDRCKIKIADFKCEDCIQFFCVGCDSYIHSLPSKIGHKRIFININFKQIPNNIIDNKNNINENIIHNSLNKKDNDIDNPILQLSEREKSNLKKKMIELNEELINIKKLLGERINIIHNHLDDINIKNKNKVNKINKENEDIIKNINLDKDTQIQYLIDELNKEKEINSKLNEKIKEYENYISLTKNQNLYEINNLNSNLENIKKEKYLIEDFYKKKIEEIQEINEKERERIIRNYEMQLSLLNENYSQNKKKYFELFQDRENQFNQYKNDSIKEKLELNSLIDKLKEMNTTSGKDQNELMNMNDTLKKALEDVNNELEITKLNLNNTNKENKKLVKKNTKILEENEQIKKANSKLHDVMYGRFGKK